MPSNGLGERRVPPRPSQPNGQATVTIVEFFGDLLRLDTKLLLSLSENREVCYITHGNLTIYFDRFLCLFDQKTKPVFGNTSILIKHFMHTVICGGSYLPIDLLLTHQKLNGSFAVCTNVVVSPDPCLDYLLDLIRSLLDLLHSRHQTAIRIIE